MTAPFPWYGSKRRQADQVWDRLGDPDVYTEPFAGSLAVLLGRREPGRREIVCDTDGGICNFWRALAADPDGVARWADWPTIHDDLTARHRWLVAWCRDNAERLREDADYYDVKAAGWWVWGISLWIGGGWCQPMRAATGSPRPNIPGGGRVAGEGVSAQRLSVPQDRIPTIQPHTGGKGVSAQTVTIPRNDGQIPVVLHEIGGQGVNAQRKQLDDKRPMVRSSWGDHSGVGVSAQRPDKRPKVQDAIDCGPGVSAQRKLENKRPAMAGHVRGAGGVTVCNGERLRPLLEQLAERLKGVIVLNRSWESAVTPTVLAQTATGPSPTVGILLDPPYFTSERHSHVYGSDVDGTSDDVAQASFDWMFTPLDPFDGQGKLCPADLYRIAYCCHDGDFSFPDGWTFHRETFSGIRRADRRGRMDLVAFSPACVQVELQGGLF